MTAYGLAEVMDLLSNNQECKITAAKVRPDGDRILFKAADDIRTMWRVCAEPRMVRFAGTIHTPWNATPVNAGVRGFPNPRNKQ